MAPVLEALAAGLRRADLHRHQQGGGGARGGAARRLRHQRRLGTAARSRHGGRGRRDRLGRRRHAQSRAGGRGDRHSRRRRALLRALAQSGGGRRRAVRPHPARSRRRLRQDAGAEPFLHLESRSLPPLRRADPHWPLAQVVHRQDHRRRGRPASPRHARRRHDCAHARRFGPARARRRREPRRARHLQGARAPPRGRRLRPTTTAGRGSCSRSAAMSATRP